NIHNEPNRQPPSFTQIPERGVVDVLGYLSAPRVPYQAPSVMPEKKPIQRVSRKKKKKGEEKKKEIVSELPPPAPPALPDNWQKLSQTRTKRPEPTPDQPPVAIDNWTLVRMPSGQVGWALSSMLLM